MAQLTYLNLSSNLVEAIGGLHTLTQLQTLDLSCNRIRLIDGLATQRRLRRLLLSFNRPPFHSTAHVPKLYHNYNL